MTTARIVALTVGALVALAPTSLAQTDADATYQDIDKTLGFVPGFFRAFSEEGISGAWQEMKSLHLSRTSLPAQTNELIGIAVAAQIPCASCSYFHTQVAKARGGTDKQIKEAIAMSALVRHWSIVMSGMQIDLST